MPRIAKYYLTGGLLLAITSLGFSQNRIAVAKADTTRIKIGEQFNVTLQLQVHVQDTVSWPELKDTLRKEVEVLAKSKIDTIFDKEDITSKVLTQRISLTSFDSGYFPVEPFRFLVNGDTLLTEPFLLEVYTVEVDTSRAIFDIKGPIDVEYTLLDWLKENWQWVAGGAVALALLAFLIYRLTRKKETPLPALPKAPPKPAHIIALQKLEELSAAKLWQGGKTKRYHVELSEIIREYIEHRYAVFALEQTTDEIMISMKSTDITDEQKAKLRQLLVLSDLVKFAKEKPIATENEMSLANAFDFVNTTKQIIIPGEAVPTNETVEQHG